MPNVMFSLPNQLVARMRGSIPAQEWNEVVCRLLDKEIESRERDLYQRAAKLETCTKLSQEMAIWDSEFGQDGL